MWRDSLRHARIGGQLLLDGSFVSTKEAPGDIDALFVIDERSEPRLLDNPTDLALISHNRIKERGIGDVFCFTESSVRNFPTLCRLDGFDIDKSTGRRKGLVKVRL